MNVIKSKNTSYCLGVEKTVNNAVSVLQQAKATGLPAYSIGSLIHNPDVVAYFEKKGLKVIHDSNCNPGITLIRAHGIPKSAETEFSSKGFTLVDSTCPVIVATKEKIKKAEADGRKIVVVGDRNHDESNTLIGTCCTEGYLVSSVDETEVFLSGISPETKLSVAVQSTFSEYEYGKICRKLHDVCTDIEFINDLCGVCRGRKKEGLELARKCDAVFVVGGKNSSNTVELAEYIKQVGKPVYLIENEKGITADIVEEIIHFETVGICSGTSTPSVVLDSVCEYIMKL